MQQNEQGVFYTNVTLLGPTQGRVVRAFRAMGRTAWITGVTSGCVVVYDERCEDGKEPILEWLTAELSRRFGCFALGVMVIDDDVLWYALFRDGRMLDVYESCAGYHHAGRQPPAGGDAQALAAAFGVPEARNKLTRVLERPSGSATSQHRRLARALGLPEAAVGFGFDALEAGEEPVGLELSRLRRIPPAAG